jgi:hypothetical protein
MSSASAGMPKAPDRAGAERPWTDASKSLDERVEFLLGQMTLEEKLAQLGSAWGADKRLGCRAHAGRFHQDAVLR